jgi:phosphoserine phosphatase
MTPPQTTPTTLILVRHGQTESNVRGLLHGQVDVPLTPLGIAQAHALAARLAEEGDIAALYASPLERARHTADIIGSVTGHRPILHPGLMEIHFGDVEGLTVHEAWERHPHLRPPEDDDGTADLRWPNGESRHGFRERARQAIEEILALHQGQKIVASTHGGVISVVVSGLIGDVSAGWQRYMVGNCALTQLTWERPGEPPTLVCLDDRAHLESVTGEVPSAELQVASAEE